MKPEIELFRIISIFGIVWYHSGVKYGRELGYGGLVFFIIISVYFAATSRHEKSVFLRVERLLIPYLLWSIFYGVFNLGTKGYFFPKQYTPLMAVLVSPSIHLWFLPFLFFVLLTIDHIRNLLRTDSFILLTGVFTILLISFSPIWRGFSFMVPFGQYAHAIPAVSIGIFLAGFQRKATWYITMATIIITVLIMVLKQQSGMGIPYLVGLLPSYFLLTENTLFQGKEFLFTASSATFGIYLSHAFILHLLIYIGISGFFLPVAAFLISLFVTICFRKYTPNLLSKYLT